ncbi:MAG: hypothetical protein Q9181_004240 [Wetmoreana brouardii]
MWTATRHQIFLATLKPKYLLAVVADGFARPTYSANRPMLNTTICSDATVCPNNFFSTNNNTCCDNHQGKTEVNYHNNARIPDAVADLTDYYASAGYTVPTDGVYKTATYPTLTATTRSTAALATGATTTPTATGSPASASATSTPSSGLGSGAKAGIGIGAAVGALAIIGIGVFLWMRRRRNLNRTDNAAGAYGSGGIQYSGIPSHEPPPSNTIFKSELPSDHVTVEMDSVSPSQDRRTHEMQG